MPMKIEVVKLHLSDVTALIVGSVVVVWFRHGYNFTVEASGEVNLVLRGDEVLPTLKTVQFPATDGKVVE